MHITDDKLLQMKQMVNPVHLPENYIGYMSRLCGCPVTQETIRSTQIGVSFVS